MKKFSVVAGVLAISFLASGCETLEWAVVRESNDPALWSRCVEDRGCWWFAQIEQLSAGGRPEALTNLMHDALVAQKPNPDLVAYLLSQGADPNATYSGMPLAFYLLWGEEGAKAAGEASARARDGDEGQVIAVLEVMKKAGLDLDWESSGGDFSWTYLGWALEANLPKVAAFLIENGARLVHVNMNSPWSQPIAMVVRARNLELLRLMLDKGSGADLIFGSVVEEAGWLEALPLVCERVNPGSTFEDGSGGRYLGGGKIGLDLALVSYCKATPGSTARRLLQACALRLLERGADPRAGEPLTNLLAPCGQSWDEGATALLETVLARGADPNARIMGDPALLWALALKLAGPAKSLLARGARADATNSSGSSALFLAIISGLDPDLVRLLLDKGANPMANDPGSGKTAVQLAIDMGKKEYVALMAPRVATAELKAAQDKAKAEQNQREAAAIAEQARAEAAAALGGGAGGGAVVGGGGGGDVQPGVRRPRPSKLPVVAVFDVEVRGVSLSKDTLEGLGELLSIRMVETGYFQVVPRDTLRTRLTDVKAGTYKPCFDQSCQIELGKELAAEQTLTTRVMKLGAECTSSLALYDLRKATAVGAASAVSECTENDIVRTLRGLVDRLTY